MTDLAVYETHVKHPDVDEYSCVYVYYDDGPFVIGEVDGKLYDPVEAGVAGDYELYVESKYAIEAFGAAIQWVEAKGHRVCSVSFVP